MEKEKQYVSRFDEYYKKYGKRPAMECYVRAMNDFWYLMGQKYTDREITKVKKMLTVLIAVSTTSIIVVCCCYKGRMQGSDRIL